MRLAFAALVAFALVALGACLDFDGTLCNPGGSCIEGYWCDHSQGTPAEGVCHRGTAPDSGTPDSGTPCTPGQTAPCGTAPNTPPCQPGTQTCTGAGTWGTCVGEVTAKTELCNGIDDDCDGIVDDNVVGTQLCELMVGVCQGATRACVDGGWETPCTELSYGPSYQPIETRCDNLDNDCNGIVDISRPVPLVAGAPDINWRYSGGAFGATYSRNTPDGPRVFFQSFTPDLQPRSGAVLLDTEPGNSVGPRIAELNGDFAVAWTRHYPDGGADVLLAEVHPDGGVVFETKVRVGVPGSAAVSGSADGTKVAVIWDESSSMFGATFSSGGAPVSAMKSVAPADFTPGDNNLLTFGVTSASAWPSDFVIGISATDLSGAPWAEANLYDSALTSAGRLVNFYTTGSTSVELRPATANGAPGFGVNDDDAGMLLSVDGGQPVVFGLGGTYFDFAATSSGPFGAWTATTGIFGGIVGGSGFALVLGPTSQPALASGGPQLGVAYNADGGSSSAALVCVP